MVYGTADIFIPATVFFCHFSILAQRNGTVKGTARDTIANRSVENATITIMRKSDSALASFVMTDAQGRFAVSGLANGQYRLLLTHVNYHSLSRYFTINDSNRNVDLGDILLQDTSMVLDKVEIKAEAPPVTLLGDTIQYNAPSFKIQLNSSVEQLLKKLPGIEVAKDGTLTAQGKKVERVLVDNKEFFGNDPKIATKNLPADMVSKVQVYDALSDQALLTGFDDGNSIKTINLKLKEDRKKGLFGKTSAGGGTRQRYEGKGNLHHFSGPRQLTLLAMGNNTNADVFTAPNMANGEQVGGKPKGSSEGFRASQAGGVNYNDVIARKTSATSNYFFNRMNATLQTEAQRQYILPGSTYYYKEQSSSNNLSNSHRINLSADHYIDSFHSLRLAPSVDFQQGNTGNTSMYDQVGENNMPISEGNTRSRNDFTRYNIGADIIFRKRFKVRGRTFFLGVNTALNKHNEQGGLQSINHYYDGNGRLLDTPGDSIFQQSKTNGSARTLMARGGYTEPLSRHSLLELSIGRQLSRERSNRLTHDYNALSLQYDKINKEQTSDFMNTANFTTAGIKMHSRRRKVSYSFGASWQHVLLEGKIIASTEDSVIARRFNNILPEMRVQYNLSRMNNLSLTYNTQTMQPQLSQLQPVPDISRLPDVKLGNPGLKQQFTHVLSLNFTKVEVFKGKSLFALVSFNQTGNKIASYDSTSNTGIRYSRPVNVNGVYDIMASTSMEMRAPFIDGQLRFSMHGAYSHDKQFSNGKENLVNIVRLGPSLTIDLYPGEKTAITLAASLDISLANYSLQPALAAKYLVQAYDVAVDCELPYHFYFNTGFTYTLNSRRSAEFNSQVPLWNVSLSKQLLKYHRGELKLNINDLLNQNTGISQFANQNFIEYRETMVLRRFILLSFTYNLSKTGLAKN